jgi:hypothetical protein
MSITNRDWVLAVPERHELELMSPLVPIQTIWGLKMADESPFFLLVNEQLTLILGGETSQYHGRKARVASIIRCRSPPV